MGSFGREELYKIGSTGITVTADGAPIAKAAGATIAWAGVPAITLAGADATAGYRTFKHDDMVSTGEKFIRYGTVICRITAATDATEIGKFIPYDGGTATGTSVATGVAGRTISIAKGDVFVVNESIHEGDRNSDYPVAIDGGRVYRRRLLVAGFGDGTEGETGEGREKYAGAAAENAADLTALGLTAFPAAAFETAFPMITYVTES